MSLEGLLTLIGIIIAVYALAQPVQRRSIPLLVPMWLVPLSIVISAGLLIWRYAVLVLCFEFYPWSDLASMVGAFLFPITGVLVAYFYWRRAKLKKQKDTKFQRFILASYYEDKFDELMRIVEKNAYSEGFRPGIPRESGHPFRTNPATVSDLKAATFEVGVGIGGRNRAE